MMHPIGYLISPPLSAKVPIATVQSVVCNDLKVVAFLDFWHFLLCYCFSSYFLTKLYIICLIAKSLALVFQTPRVIVLFI